MGLPRAFAKVVSGFLFTTFLASVIFTQVVAHLTNYETLKPIIVDVLKQQFTMTPEQLNATHAVLLYQCQASGNETIYIQSIELKCSDISSISYMRLPDLVSNVSFDKIYFKKYDCSFFQCIQLPEEEKFLFLMSKQANKFFKELIVYLWIVTIFSVLILIVATETWPKRFKAVGLSLVFVGISYFLIPLIKGFFVRQVPQQTLERVSPILDQIFDPISANLLIVLVIGIILIILGLLTDYFIKRKESKKK